MKKKIFLVGMVFLLTFAVTGCKNDKKTDKEKKTIVVKEKNVIKDQVVEDFRFSNTSLKYENGLSKLVTEVTNNSSSTQTLQSFSIIVKDKEGNELISLLGIVSDDKLRAGQTKRIISSTDLNLSSAKSIEYKINR